LRQIERWFAHPRGAILWVFNGREAIRHCDTQADFAGVYESIGALIENLTGESEAFSRCPGIASLVFALQNDQVAYIDLASPWAVRMVGDQIRRLCPTASGNIRRAGAAVYPDALLSVLRAERTVLQFFLEFVGVDSQSCELADLRGIRERNTELNSEISNLKQREPYSEDFFRKRSSFFRLRWWRRHRTALPEDRKNVPFCAVDVDCGTGTHEKAREVLGDRNVCLRFMSNWFCDCTGTVRFWTQRKNLQVDRFRDCENERRRLQSEETRITGALAAIYRARTEVQEWMDSARNARHRS
jgi:hypothetical protein